MGTPGHMAHPFDVERILTGQDLIDYITDTTPEKQGKYSPGTHIPIISPEEGFDNSVDFAFLGAWNFAEEIKKIT